MAIKKMIYRVVDLYVDGFRHLTWGKSLWIVILVKLLIIFAILKIFFFPDYIATHRGKNNSADFVGKQVLQESRPSQQPVSDGSKR